MAHIIKINANMSESLAKYDPKSSSIPEGRLLFFHTSYIEYFIPNFRPLTRILEFCRRLRVIVSEANDKLEAMKANVDDEYKLMEQTRQEYRDIITEYKNTSAAYHVSRYHIIYSQSLRL